MSHFGTTDFALEVALGNVAGYGKVNKFGEARDCDSGDPTDVWDGSDGSTSTKVWEPPTQARVHDIDSTSVNDTSAGTGMRTVEVFGLEDWDSAETSEIVILNGTTPVPTANSYVIIHRMIGRTFGTLGTNDGIIIALAQTDGTETAIILAGEGQTLMAIYGVPSTQTLQIEFLRSDILRLPAGSVKVDGTLLVKENANLATAAFITKERVQFTDERALNRPFPIPKTCTGPCIVKYQVLTNSSNAMVTASFDGYVVDN